MEKTIELVYSEFGVRPIALGVHKDNAGAERFYLKHGFRKTNVMEGDDYYYLRYPSPFSAGELKPLTRETAEKISGWEYEPPYAAYSFNGHADWLMDESTWGTEQFCLMNHEEILGQVSCQLDGEDLWVGWSMNPQFCGSGNGGDFVRRCVSELRRLTGHSGKILLRVAAWNTRAIRAYQKAGFAYVETIQDEIAYSSHMEDFWVMELE